MEEKIEDWCSHIGVELDYRTYEYIIYGKRVPMSWICCPECGAKRPSS